MADSPQNSPQNSPRNDPQFSLHSALPGPRQVQKKSALHISDHSPGNREML
jgi:hypothetical protein